LLHLMPLIIAVFFLGLLGTRVTSVQADTAQGGAQEGALLPEAQPGFDPFLLNIRMSRAPVQPPPDIIKQTWVLDGYRLGKLGAEAPRAAVIDDDQHQRLLILSATDDGGVRLYRVADLPLEVGTRLSRAMLNAQTRDCRHQRMDPAGELGCLAVSLLEALQE
jgi:hypothetical protein